MNFTNLADLVQVFVNEYCNPASLILFVGQPTNKILDIFKFVDSEVIVVDNIRSEFVDITISNGSPLPFESHSFDLIIKINDCVISDLNNFLKPNGKLLIKSECIIVGSVEYYTMCNQLFNVL